MSQPITTADVLPFDWGDYTYQAKQDLSIECKPSPHWAGRIIASCEVLDWVGSWDANWEHGRWSAIQSLRRTIHNRCQHWLLTDDSALTAEGLIKKRQLDQLFTVTLGNKQIATID